MCIQKVGKLENEKLESVNFVSHNEGQSNKVFSQTSPHEEKRVAKMKVSVFSTIK